MARNTLTFEIKFKMADFLLGLGHVTMRLFFKSWVTWLHLPTECHTCRWNIQRGLLRWNVVGGAIEPDCYSPPKDLHQIKTCTTSNVCVKFNDGNTILSPSKTASRFMAKHQISHTVTPFIDLLRLAQLFIVKVFRLHCQDLKLIWLIKLEEFVKVWSL